MVVEPGSNGTIGIGFTHSNHDVTRHVGWDAGTFGLHGDNGETYFEGCSEYYGFKYGKGDVVGAALDFQRKEIFFTKNGTKGKAISISISQALYPTVSLRSSGGFVSVNFGQKPFSFNIDPFKIKVGGKVAIKSTSVDAAMGLQVGHGGWGSSMAKMLGKPGVVESVDMDGDVRVKMDDGSGSMLWNPALVLPNAAMLSPFAAVSADVCDPCPHAFLSDPVAARRSTSSLLMHLFARLNVKCQVPMRAHKSPTSQGKNQGQWKTFKRLQLTISIWMWMRRLSELTPANHHLAAISMLRLDSGQMKRILAQDNDMMKNAIRAHQKLTHLLAVLAHLILAMPIHGTNHTRSMIT
ncbi:hypothetical protein Vafri_12242 [Volvox africanus]|uniref:B30.2/SPRY domain-containing protein n=1 Tax=Volvox africanus TaxID=51714 RepID=A0A8J4B9V6_9CHLO|nr:hypothetical protein Vafri_12242 [Volvox africanus]